MKIAAFTLALVLVSCAPVTPPPQSAPAVRGVTLSAEPPAAGEVLLILQNGSTEPVGYNLCSSALQRWDGVNWTNVETDDVCTMELRSLPPGTDATFRKRLPANLAAGEYRYVASVEIPMGTPQVPVATEGFRAGS